MPDGFGACSGWRLMLWRKKRGGRRRFTRKGTKHKHQHEHNTDLGRFRSGVLCDKETTMAVREGTVPDS